MVWVLRWFASALRADETKTMFTYLFGPGGSGKDTVVALMSSLLGSGRDGYVRFLKKTYFVKEQSPEAPSPFLCSVVGARWVVVTEIPRKAILPDNLKDICDHQGAELSTRALFQSPTSFHPFFRLAIMSNHEFHLDEPDDGVERRRTQLTHQRLFKSKPTAPHHVQSNANIKKHIKAGKYVHETFALAIAFASSLTSIPGDVILPLPCTQQVENEERAEASKEATLAGMLQSGMLLECEAKDATKADAFRSSLAIECPEKSQTMTAFLIQLGLKKKKNFFPSMYFYHFERDSAPVAVQFVEHSKRIPLTVAANAASSSVAAN